MLKPILFLVLLVTFIQSSQAQKKHINREIAQINYEGYLMMEEQNYDSAFVLFNKALKADPEAFFIYQNRAICNLHLKDTIGAINDFKANIKLDSENAESHYSLGNIYKHQKDSVNSIKYFIASINKADPEFSQKKLLYMNNFVGHFYRNKEKYDSALIYYNQVKKYTPKNPSVFINGALCYFNLDSLDQYCEDLEQAFILGGAVNCYILKSYCKGCNHLLAITGMRDTLSKALDKRLKGIISDTLFHYSQQNYKRGTVSNDLSKKQKVYFNKYWQICLPENAKFYREAFWAKGANFFGGSYTDYYNNGEIYAKGRIDKKQNTGSYKRYHENGNLKIQGQFIKGQPTGTWTYFIKDGSPDFKITFFFDEFEVEILNESNPNFQINSGMGKFEIQLDQMDDIQFIISGEFIEKERAGK